MNIKNFFSSAKKIFSDWSFDICVSIIIVLTVFVGSILIGCLTGIAVKFTMSFLGLLS